MGVFHVFHEGFPAQEHLVTQRTRRGVWSPDQSRMLLQPTNTLLTKVRVNTSSIKPNDYSILVLLVTQRVILVGTALGLIRTSISTLCRYGGPRKYMQFNMVAWNSR